MSLDAPEKDALLRLPLFARLQPNLAELVERLFQPREFEFGETIFSEGDPPDGMYVIVEGSVRVLINHEGHETTLARFGPGDWFGEAAFLESSARTATVRASEHVKVMWLDAFVFTSLLELHPEIREAFGDQTRIQTLHRFLRTHAAFENLSLEAATAMFPALEPVTGETGSVVVRQGDPGGAMYFVEDGRLEVSVASDAKTRVTGFLRTGDIFGERSLVTGEPRAATVRALTDVRLLKLEQRDFAELATRFKGFGGRVEEIVALRDHQAEARVPLDIHREILPGGIAETGPSESDVASTLPAPGATPVQPSRRRGRFPFVQQLDEMDCGVACLSMLAKFHRIDVSISWLRDVAKAGPAGTTLRGISEAGAQLGLEIVPYKVSRDRLDELGQPAIIHWDKNHWIVLVGVDERGVEVADPALGVYRMSREELNAHWDGYAARVTPTGEKVDVPTSAPNLRWLMPFLRKYRRTITAAAVLALAAAGSEVALPLIVEAITNDVVKKTADSTLDFLGLGILGLAVAGTAASLAQRLVLSGTSARFDTETLGFITERLLGLPMSYFETRRIGDIERRLSGAREVRRIIVQQGVDTLTSAIQFIVGLVIMFVISWQLALVYIAVTPFYLLAMRYSTNRLRPLYAGIEEHLGRYSSDQIDMLKGIETVKSTGTEDGLRRRLQSAFATLMDQTSESRRVIARFGSVIQLISLLTYGLFVFLGGLFAHSGDISLGGYVAFTALVLMITGPLVSVVDAWDDVQISAVLLNRIADVLEHEPEQGFDSTALISVPTLEGRVQLRHVAYKPPGTDEPVLSDIDLDVEPGTTVAVVGRSGSGKTTLLRLLAGLIEPTSGAILYDRVDSRTLRYRDLRRQVGFVLQDPYVFATSIANNIALGEDKVDRDALNVAAQIADFSELVERLPLGYDTPVGDRGLPLSGGQAQRLAIARALYHQPPVLLFDEATSALDSESEAIVKRNIDRLLEGRTAFVVAHRLSTIRNADTIVVLERGRLVEQGTHEELLERRGVYFYLLSQQLSAPDAN
jgi:ABC-type bacteriocin/lantibiotic exporter with double-glycine peptidase domain/CRP-like cAMP-binding protein